MNLLALAITGVIVRWVLPLGTSGRGQALHGGRGGEHIEQLWSMTRHDWGTIHFYLAILFVSLMVVHIILHWSWIKCYIKSLFGLPPKIN